MSGSWAFLADGALLEGQGSLTPVEVSFWVLLHALCPPTHAIVWALALASTGARVLGRHGFHHSARLPRLHSDLQGTRAGPDAAGAEAGTCQQQRVQRKPVVGAGKLAVH